MAAESHITIPLETLLSLLRAEGFQDISTTAILDIQKVLANLDEEEIKDYRKLKYFLSPIICRNKEDQEKFSQVFDQYVTIIEGETKKQDRITAPQKHPKFVRRIVIAGLAVAFILALIWWFTQPKPHKPYLSLSKSTYWPVGKYAEDAIGDSMGYEAYLHDTIAGKKYTIDWQLEDTSYINSRAIRKVYTDTGYHTAYAYVKDEEGETITDSISTHILSVHPPSVSIQRGDENKGRRIYTAIPGDSSAKTNQYRYKWYINDSLTSAKKEFLSAYRSNKPYEVKLVVDSRGLYSNKNYDSLSASIREVPEYSLGATGLAPLQTSSIFQAGNLLWMLAFLLLIPLGVTLLIFRLWKKPKPFPHTPDIKPEDTLPPEEDKKKSEHTEGPFFIEFKKQDYKISPEEQISRLADGLRKRQLSDVYKLHLKKTIYKTIRAGGFPSFEFAPKTKPVDFLVLIDKEYPEGHLVKLFEYLVDRLRSEEVNITVYDYYKEPLYLNNPKFNHIHIPLDRVAQLYPDTVLFLFTTGEYFFESLKSKLKPWAEEKFKVWENRIIITPAPRKDWTYKESILQQSGFAIISADLYQNNLLKILLDFVNLQVETTKKEKIEIPQTYSARYFNFQEFDALKKYLDNPELLNWVSATAVYTAVDWKATVAIGKALEEEAKSNEEMRTLVTYENLLKISRISWMQDGIVDDTLRLEMLRHIDNTTEAVARKAIVELLEEIKEQFTEKSFAKEEFELHDNSNRLLLHAHDKGNPVSDETAAAVREYISKGYLDWPQSVYHQEARNTLMKGDNDTASVPPEVYFRNFDQDNEDRKKREEEERKKQEEELRQKEKRRKRLRNLAAGGALLLLSFIGGWLLNQNGILQLWKILPASLQVILRQTEQLKQLGDISVSIKMDTSSFESKKENDSVFVFNDLPAYNKDQQATFVLDPPGGNQMFTTISLDSSYLISLTEPAARTALYIRHNNLDFYSAIEQQVINELYRYSIDALQEDFKDSSRIVYYSEDQKAMADSVAAIMKDKFTINVRVEFIRENRTPPAVPILFLNLASGDKTGCTIIPINTLPKTLNEIWHGGTSNRLININLGQQVMYYSVNDTKTFGTYRIDEVCLGNTGIYKIITRAGNQYQVFLLKNVQSSSFELSVCQNRYNTKEEARVIDESYCDRFNAMKFYYVNNKSRIYLPVRSVSLLPAEAAKIRIIADQFNLARKENKELKLTTAVYENDKYLSQLVESVVLKYLPNNNLNYDLRTDDWLEMPSSDPFKRNYITIETEIISRPDTTPQCNRVFYSLKEALSVDARVICNLDLSKENLTTIPKELFQFINLRELTLGETKISEEAIKQLRDALKCNIKYTRPIEPPDTNKEIDLGTILIDAKGYPDSKSLELIRNIALQLKANSNRRIRLEATYTSTTEQKNITGYIRTIKNLFYKEGIAEKLQPIDERVTAMQNQQQQQQQKNIPNRIISDYTGIDVIGINFPDNSQNKSKD
jgi:hypothetical protein